MKPVEYRLRKVSDIHREHPLYEIVDEDRKVLLDIAKTDGGVYEACIMDNEGKGRVVELSVLLELIQEAQRRIEADE